MRLAVAALRRLSTDIARPGYDRDAQKIGIVHLGIGAFHRAHQAWYTDLVMNRGERDWAICGVSLRSDEVAKALNPQDGLYTLTERGSGGAVTRVIGSVREVLRARRNPEAAVRRLAAPETRVVTMTVTEKGYCRKPDGSLDLAVARDISIYSLLAEAICERKAKGRLGLTVLSCDNLSGNGDQFRLLMRQYLSAEAPDLVGWFEFECACPNSMVDRIVPATASEDLDWLEPRLGLRDEGAVFSEPFSQWVIEEKFAGRRPGWERVGAELVADVAPYEAAKLRMLNGAHSALAYLGLERGFTFVHEAIADPKLRFQIERLLRWEAAPTIVAAPGQNLGAYADALLTRFENPAMQHRLLQIAMDGSEKIPQRWLQTLKAQRARDGKCPAILTALAAWLRHVRGDSHPVNDPRAKQLAALWQSEGRLGIVAAVLGSGGMLAPALGDEDQRSVTSLL